MKAKDKRSVALKEISFIYPIGDGDSGQRRASELICEVLPRQSWHCQVLPVPVLRRRGNLFISYIRYLSALAVAWIKIFSGLKNKILLHWSIGQTPFAWIRDGVPIRIARAINPKLQIVVSLHGSNFLEWTLHDKAGRRFARQLQLADIITVLGSGQKRKLLELGLSGEKIRILPNCSEYLPMDASALKEKHSGSGQREIVLLFLSSLIDTKGYPHYLKALEKISVRINKPVRAILCGRVMVSPFSRRFATPDEARSWIEEQISRINKASNVRAEWIEGAWAEDKKKLYEEADLFVFPSTYKVEAQPLVLLEAMAHGCAVITSTVGEIPGTVLPESATLLDEVSPESVEDAIVELVNNDARRVSMGEVGWRHYAGKYTPVTYRQSWESVFNALLKGKGGRP